MRIAYVFLARYAEFGSDGTISCFGKDLEIVRFPVFPATVYPLTIVARVMDLPTPAPALSIKLDIVTPGGSNLLEEPFKAKLEPKEFTPGVSGTNPSTANVLINLGGVQIPEPGRYEIRLYIVEGAVMVSATAVLTAEVTHA